MLESIELMILGMGSVFLFLSVLVVSVKGLSHLVSKLDVGSNANTSPPSASSDSSSTASTANAPVTDPELISVITSALHQYRASQQDDQKNDQKK